MFCGIMLRVNDGVHIFLSPAVLSQILVWIILVFGFLLNDCYQTYWSTVEMQTIFVPSSV